MMIRLGFATLHHIWLLFPRATPLKPKLPLESAKDQCETSEVISLAPILLILSLVNEAPHETPETFDYGRAYLAETQDRELPRLHLSAGYAMNISDSFVDLDSVVGTAQFRVWKYFSTGILGQFVNTELSDAGDQIRRLESVDIKVKIPSPRWGLFSLSYLQFMLGRWNLFNLIPVEAEVLVGGGAGVVNRELNFGATADGGTENRASYLWSVEQRFLFYENAGVFVSLFGHRDASFLQTGLHLSFK